MTHENQIYLSVFFVVLLSGAAMGNTPVRKCNNKAPLPLMVYMDDCSELPCEMIKGTVSNMDIQFVATKNNMTTIRADVRFSTVAGNVAFELDESRRDVCKNLRYGAFCPLYRGEDVNYHLTMNVAEQQEEVPVQMEVSLLDTSDNSVVTCFVTDARVRRQNLRSSRIIAKA